MKDERKPQQNLQMFHAESQLQPVHHTHICLHHHIKHVDKNIQCDFYFVKWLHSRIYGMIQVLICVLVHVIHHMAQNMATVYTIHKKYFIYLNTRLFPNSPEKWGSSLYTIVMYSGKSVSLSRINTVRYVQKYYCKTLPPGQNG